MLDTEWTPMQMCASCFRHSSRERVAIPAQVMDNSIIIHDQPMHKRCIAVIDSWGHAPYWYAGPSVAKFWVIELFLGREVLLWWTLTWINCKIKLDELVFFVEFSNIIQFWNKPNMHFFFWTIYKNWLRLVQLQASKEMIKTDFDWITSRTRNI